MDKLDLNILMKRAWILIAAMLIGAFGAYVITQVRPTQYEAQAQLMVGPGIDSPNPDLNVLRAGGQLIQMYAELPLTQPFLQKVIDELKLDIQPSQLAKMIDIRPNPETQILTIQVLHSDGDIAKAIAKAIANQLVEISPSNPESTAAQIKSQVRSQVTELEQTITETKAEIEKLESDYQKAVEEEKLSREIAGSSQTISEQLREFDENRESISSAATQREAGVRILQELVINTNARILMFEHSLKEDTNTTTQKMLIDQVRMERNHLSQLQQTIAEIQRPVEGLPLDQYITASQATITELEQGLDKLIDVDYRRLQIDRIVQEQKKLEQARLIESDRQKQILEQIAGERERISQVELSGIEKKQLIFEQITTERGRLFESQNTLALLYNSMREADPNQVKIIDLASEAKPISASLGLAVIIGALAGLFLSSVGVLSLHSMQDSITSSEQLAKVFSVPVIDIDSKPGSLNRLLHHTDPQQEIIHKYQMLGLHLIYKHRESETKFIVVGATSGSDSPGIAAANLAISLSQSGKRVILIDGDRREPSVTSLFYLEQREGLSDFLSGSGMKPSALVSFDRYPTLVVWPFGTTRIEPALLASPRMLHQIDRLKERADVVLCVVPVIHRPDALALASYANGVVLALSKGKITQKALNEILENLNLVGAKVLAVVMKAGKERGLAFEMRREGFWNRPGTTNTKGQAEKQAGLTGDSESSEAVGTSVSS